MAQLLHINPESESRSDFITVAIGKMGTAIHHDGSIATLAAPTDRDQALHSAAVVITRETECDGDGSLTANSRHFLIASPGTSVLLNGNAITTTGIAALSRKDEIFLTCESEVRRFYFSDEVIPEPEAIDPGLSADACCPRCQRALHAPSPTADGLEEEDDERISRKPLIRCGGCGSLYHAHGCYDYEPTCLICLAPTSGHKLWTPEELD